MNIEIDIETVANAVSVTWAVAYKAETYKEWLHGWGNVERDLGGMWDLVNYGCPCGQRDAVNPILREISDLKEIAFILRFHMNQLELPLDHPTPIFLQKQAD